ncbi:mannan endo-1,4-beta-mannosidase-like [Biomphalaria glabrata]|uniref:Mannan endo-1,4-beta-mannosidase-like n=1 Tax=Biomphalaria glabrata TaxID=6526 RepID=A0A9W3B5Y4_BIOGL|nr:mannan endo-1,4-beta-mannosidase-like [Biomphalaria glabrata]
MRTCILWASLWASLLHSAWAAVDVPVTNHWNGGFQAETCFDIFQDLHAWNVTLTFDIPVTSMNVWTATVAETRDGGKVYVLHNQAWNQDEHVGDRLCISFFATTSEGDVVPKVQASLTTTTGEVTTPGPLTAAPGHTLKPTNAPGTFQPGSRLSIDGTHFTYNNQRIFLSGVNLPWISYAYDFGDGLFQQRKVQLEHQMRMLHDAGGNSMRLWIHIQAETTPAFNSSGMVIGLDTKGTFLSEFIELLNLGQKYDILITPCLWNAAVNQDAHNRLDGLLRDPVKLQSYIDNALIPWATAVKGHPALGSWDIMNEPEGMLNPEIVHADPCFDTTALKYSGAGWAGKKYNYEQFLRFLNWQAAAIKQIDPKYLVSVGVSNPRFNTDKFGDVDHYSDSCLIKAGGKPTGVMDFYQFHSYSWEGKFVKESPFLNNFTEYVVSKPILVGEFNEQDGGGMTIVQMFDWTYNHGYAGAWSWDFVGHPEQGNGIRHIKDLTTNGVIPISVQ